MRRTDLGLQVRIFIFQMYKSKKETCTILELLMDNEALKKDNEKILEAIRSRYNSAEVTREVTRNKKEVRQIA